MKLFVLGLVSAVAVALGSGTASAQYVVYPAGGQVLVAPPPPPLMTPGVAVGVAAPGVAGTVVVGGPPAVSVGIGLPLFRPFYGPWYGPHFHNWRR